MKQWRSWDLLKPANANRAYGSFWIVRRAAWEPISEQMTDRSYYYSDWRLLYFLLKRGWKALWTPEQFGIVRSYDCDYPTGENWKWENYVKKLEATF